MRKRMMIVAAGALLCAGALAAAQDVPAIVLGSPQQAATVDVDRSGVRTITGGISFEINGVLVKADKAVITGREVALEGNVRVTLPAPPSRFIVSRSF